MLDHAPQPHRRLAPSAARATAGPSAESRAPRALPIVWVIAACAAALVAGCPDRSIMPLIGDGPEIAELLDKPLPEASEASALAAARGLHQALVQKDTDKAWALLAPSARRALDDAAATAGAGGRELLDASVLPDGRGGLRNVRYADILFGASLVELTDGPPPAAGPDGMPRAAVFAVGDDGTVKELVFVRGSAGWALHLDSLGGSSG